MTTTPVAVPTPSSTGPAEEPSMSTRLLVPIDVNGCAQEVVERAVWLGRLTHAEVILLACFDEPEGAPAEAQIRVDGSRTTIDQLLEDELKSAIVPFARMVERADLGLRVFVRHGAPAKTILTVCDEVRPDLIVMGTHGRTGLSRVVFGSVAEEVLRHAPCAVLVEPAGRGREAVMSPAMLQAIAEADG